MDKLKAYKKLFRLKHSVKNLIILLPALCSGDITSLEIVLKCLMGIYIFTMASSGIYAMNDVFDAESDRKHPSKCHRPVASGVISEKTAATWSVILLSGAVLLSWAVFGIWPAVLLAGYIVSNFAYSRGLKRVPVIETVILSSGFLMRAIYGTMCCDIYVSYWVYLTVWAFSLYFSFMKRYNELTRVGACYRPVLQKYSEKFLHRVSVACLVMTDVFFALWTMCPGLDASRLAYFLPISIPVMAYVSVMLHHMQAARKDDGDMVTYVLSDKVQVAAFLGLIGIISCCIYF